jgi:RNA polymerase sigma-70 factor, ECF subfamily
MLLALAHFSGGYAAPMKLPWRTPPDPREPFNREALPHLESVYRYALRLSGGHVDAAEDIAQETMLQAYRGWHTYRPGTNCLAWLFTICRNCFLRGEERRGRRPEVPVSDLDADVEALASTAVFAEVRAGVDPEREFFDNRLDEGVEAALDALPALFREAVLLSDLEGLTYAEIANVLSVPPGTVKSRLFRGRRLLQEALYEYALENGYVRPRSRA